jgi:uncharacterized protein (DUF1697 family)
MTSEMATVYIALLRGINIGPRRRVAMGDLRDVFTSLGYEDVQTYVQSGNVVFRSAARPEAARIAAELGQDIAVLIRSAREMACVVDGNPFLPRGADPSHVHVTFLDGEPEGEMEAPASGRDEFEIAGREIYVHCPDGYGRTKLTNALFEKRLGLPATTRNWRTVTTLAELASGGEPGGGP